MAIKKLVSKAILLIILLMFFYMLSVDVAQANSKSSKGKVLVVFLPRVSWEVLKESNSNNIDKLASNYSVANISVRVPKKSRTIEKAYASLSAGNRADVPLSKISTFYGSSEQVGDLNAFEVYKRQRGNIRGEAKALSINYETTKKLNDGVLSTKIGTLAQYLAKNNRKIGVIGNSDNCLKTEASCLNRSVGYFGADTRGVVESGDITRDLLNNDLSMDMKKVGNKAVESLKTNDVTAVECSDLNRIDSERKLTDPKVLDKKIIEAINSCDKLIGELLQNVNLSKDQVYILSPMSSSSKEELNIFIAAGNKIPSGYATSGFTRREGIVSLSDVAPSILNFYEIKPPDTMVGSLLDYKKSKDDLIEKQKKLIDVNDAAITRDDVFDRIAVTFIAVVFLTVLISVLAYNKFYQLINLSRYLSLFCLIMPLASFLISPTMVEIADASRILMAFIFVSAFLALLLYRLMKKLSTINVIFGISVAYVSFFTIDISTGGNFQLNSLFGYSAIIAGRFAGFGNMAFSLLSVTSIILVASASVIFQNVSKNLLNSILIIFLFMVLFLEGSPYFGSDIGGIIALVPMISYFILKLYGKVINLKYILVASLLTFLTITIFSLFDLKRPLTERTHLGRFIQVLMEGRAGAIIERKLYANMHILTNSTSATIVVLATIFLLILFFKPESFINEISKKQPVFKLIFYPSLIVGILGMLFNDSGVAIPGMMISIAVPVLFLLAFEEKERNLNIFQSSKTSS